MVSASARRRATRIPVPGALFSHTRVPPFVLFDDFDEEIDLRDRAGEAPAATLYVPTGDVSGLRYFLRQHLHQLTVDEEIAVEDRAWSLHRVLLYETTDAYRRARARVSLQPLLAPARDLAQFALQQRGTFPFMPIISGTDYSLTTHAVETALYAIALAVADDRRDIDALAALALGALFADLGKVELSALVEREGPLTEEDWEQMHRHPRRSLEILRAGGGVVPAGAIRAILTHHERWDGSGYPKALIADEIPYEGRVAGIADAFSAMTVNRTYRVRVDPYEALTEMAVAQERFDPSLIRSFVLLLGSVSEGA